MLYHGAVPIVTLTTDFGTSDGYVGAMKGVIIRRCPDATIIDIAHDVPSFDIAAGGYCLRQAAGHFPDGTVHVAVIDPGVGTERRAVVVDGGAQRFVGPDNGIFSWVIPRPVAAYAIESTDFMRGSISATFHGRDIFAAAAGALAAGAQPSEAGPPLTLAPPDIDEPLAVVRAPDRRVQRVRACVVHIDQFGNLISNCPVDLVPDGARVSVPGQDGRDGVTIERISRTFGEVGRGQPVAYIGSAETLEIAVREDSAARILGLAKGALITIEPSRDR